MMYKPSCPKLNGCFSSMLLLMCSGIPVFANGTVELIGTVYYNQAPISEVTNVTPTLHVSDLSTSLQVSTATLTYNNTTGAYTIGNLPVSSLSVTLIFHVTGSTYTLPGNYWVSDYPDLTLMTDAERTNHSLTAYGMIHQTSPWDNSHIDFALPPADPYPVHSRHLDFLWDPVPGAVQYRFTVRKYRDSDHPQGYGYLETVLSIATLNPSYSVDLEDSQPYEHYESAIFADNPVDNYIASLWVTYTNAFGWDYRFKTAGYDLILKQVKFKSGKADGTDSFTISGVLDSVTPADFVNGDTITLQLGNLNPFIIDQPLKQSGSKAKYSYKGTPGLKMNLDNGLFKISAKNVDLTGLTAPVDISITFGNYSAWASALDEGTEDIINGKKYLSLEFLSGYADALRIDSVQIKTDSQPQSDSLSIKGAVSADDPADSPAAAGLVLTWGAQTFTIPAGDIIQINNAYSFKQVLSPEGAVLSGSIDLSKCLFKITVKSADLTAASGTVSCSLSFQGFNQTDDYTLP